MLFPWLQPLCCVCRCLEYLLRNDANPGIRDNQGYNAVHYASAYGHRLCLELVRTSSTRCVTITISVIIYCYIVMMFNALLSLHCLLQIASETPLDVVGWICTFLVLLYTDCSALWWLFDKRQCDDLLSAVCFLIQHRFSLCVSRLFGGLYPIV